MNQRNLRDPQAFERANYIKILQGYHSPDLSLIGHKENSKPINHNGVGQASW